MTELLINLFVKNPDSDSMDTRARYGLLGSMVGIIVNILLFSLKLTVGLLINSISVMADAFNNLSDTASSIITMFGFKLGSMPADDNHPFGHGRIEYFSGLIVSVLVLYVGIQFMVSSVMKIVKPEPLNFQWVPVILLTVSILSKIWISTFNSRLGKRINSSALKASALDARGDVMISSTVVSGLLISRFFNVTIDGYVGLFVAVMILKSALALIKDTINPLLGDNPDEELVENIEKTLLEFDEIFGVHDTVVHNYGPNIAMGSTHVEVRDDIPVTEIHDIIDRAEARIAEKYKIEIVAHMDPIRVSDETKVRLIKSIIADVKNLPGVSSIHDTRIRDENPTGKLYADLVINTAEIRTDEDETKLLSQATDLIKTKYALDSELLIDKKHLVVRSNGQI